MFGHRPTVESFCGSSNLLSIESRIVKVKRNVESTREENINVWTLICLLVDSVEITVRVHIGDKGTVSRIGIVKVKGNVIT